jgi:conjugal transfer pilus assembly protein TraV
MYNTKMRGVDDTTITNKNDTETEGKQKLVPRPSATLDPGVEIVKNMDYRGKLPVRVAPKVIRIWIAPWEDSDGDLNQPGYVFSEINDKRGRWLFGEKETTSSQPMLKPVERLPMDPDEMKQAQGQDKPSKAGFSPPGEKEPTLKLK